MGTTEEKTSRRHVETPDDKKWARYLAFYSFIVLLIVIYHMIILWGNFPQLTLASNETITASVQIIPGLPFYFPKTTYTAETVIMIGMMIAGIMGACIFSLWAISHHTGAHKDFDASWKYWYILRPPLGGGLAFILYILLRGGIMSFGTNLENLNPVGLAGISGLAGMFVEHAMHKLLELADTLYKPPPIGEPPSEVPLPFSSVNERIMQAMESYEKEQYASSVNILTDLTDKELPELICRLKNKSIDKGRRGVKKDGMIIALAAVLVLFTAILDPRISAGLAIILMIAFAIYKR